MSPNRVPEKRVGIALILIGTFSLVLYVVNSAVTQTTDPLTFFFIAIMLMLGVGLRSRFKHWDAPPPPPPKAAPKPAAPASKGGGGGGLRLPFGKKPAPPAAAPPNRQPPPPIPAKPKGFLGKLDDVMKPKNKK